MPTETAPAETIPTAAAAPQTVGIREFRENLASYVESETPIAITRHGQTIGTYIPNPHKRPKVDWAAMEERARLIQAQLAAVGLTEDDIIADLKELKAKRREGVNDLKD